MENKQVILPATDYQRLFRFEYGDIPAILIGDIIQGYYYRLQCLAIATEGVWTCYLPALVIQRLNQDGLVFFGDINNFEEYRNAFLNFINVSRKFFEDILSRDEISQEDVRHFLSDASLMFEHYSKTEQFYTDEAYRQSVNNPILKKNLILLSALKNETREYLNQIIFADGYVSRFIKIIARQFAVPEADLIRYYVSDILALYQNQKVSPESLKRRGQKVVWIGDGIKTDYYEGDEIKSTDLSFTNVNQVVNELSGTVANKGDLRGRVKIIYNNYFFDLEKLAKMNESMAVGDILVAESTGPEVMMLCQKASAILADQGGLLSHAAIISRELNIPCIVGLDKATRVLHDGDLVEIDGEKGIVRIVEKS